MSFLITSQAGNLKMWEAATGDVLKKRRSGVSEPAVHRSSTKEVFLNN